MSERLAGKVAIVTGAARGLGAAVAEQLAAEGASVVIGDVLDAEGEALARSLGDTVRFARLDVADESQWAAIVEFTTATFGSVDILVNNAAITDAAPLADYSLAAWQRVLDVNLTGTFLGMRAVVRPMLEGGGGSIVNVSSVDGLRGLPGVHAYGASKFGVRGLTKSAAVEFAAHGIRVNSVHPGHVRTPMVDGAADGFLNIPIDRAAEPVEVSRMICWLASDEASYATGAEFVVDGGLTAVLPHQPVDLLALATAETG
jgi:3alpha(or 20beta)-hydroxysteroid dehydrogenase